VLLGRVSAFGSQAAASALQASGEAHWRAMGAIERWQDADGQAEGDSPLYAAVKEARNAADTPDNALRQIIRIELQGKEGCSAAPGAASGA
jgi:hypothetical protein